MLKKPLTICIIALTLAWVMAPFAAAQELPEVTCEAYVVMDADTGQVIMEKNPDQMMYPASITKIMTLALAMEKAQGDWSEQRTISQEVTTSLEQGSSHIALLPGEVVSLQDLIYGTQLESANDGANALAEYISDDDTIQGGVDKMNQKAQQLGLTNTHYMNPHGLHDAQHYTTARDMANLTRWALSVPGFLEVFSRKECLPLEATNMQQARTFWCADLMRVGGATYYRDYVVGSKTGYHDQAGHTLVTYAQQDGINLISVVLKSAATKVHFLDTAALLDYAFAHYSRVELAAPAETLSVPLMGGGETALGNLTLTPAGASALLSDAFTAQDVTVEYAVPEHYLLGQGFKAQILYKLPESNGIQPSLVAAVDMKVSGLAALLEANTQLVEAKPYLDPLVWKVGLGAGMAVLAAIVAAAAAGLKRKGGAAAVARQKASQNQQESWLPDSPFVVYQPSPRWEQRTNHTGEQIRRRPGQNNQLPRR